MTRLFHINHYNDTCCLRALFSSGRILRLYHSCLSTIVLKECVHVKNSIVLLLLLQLVCNVDSESQAAAATSHQPSRILAHCLFLFFPNTVMWFVSTIVGRDAVEQADTLIGVFLAICGNVWLSEMQSSLFALPQLTGKHSNLQCC